MTKPKDLPLEVTLLHLGFTTLTSRDRPSVEVLLKNIGDSPFLLPVEREEDKIIRPGHKNVQTVFIGLEFASPANAGVAPSIGFVGSACGSPSVPASLLTVLPGETVRITSKLSMVGFGFDSWYEQGFRSVSSTARAVVSILDVDPEERIVSSDFNRRESKNSIEILWKAPGRSQ